MQQILETEQQKTCDDPDIAQRLVDFSAGYDWEDEQEKQKEQ